MLILNKELINACRTENTGTFTAETVKWFGLSFKNNALKKGWVKELIGKQITEEDYQKALKGRLVFRKQNNQTSLFI